MPNTQVTEELFRDAWAKFATGVSVVTTHEVGGSGLHGMTANSVTSVSLDPLLVAAVIGNDRNTLPLIEANQRFGISILNFEQRGVARHYTVPDAIRATLPEPPSEKLGDSLVIAGSLAAMDCKVTQSIIAGDHTIFIAEVEQVKIGMGEPLIFYEGHFESLA